MLLSVDDVSRVAEVRREATNLARTAGLTDEGLGHAAILATELATNILKHAGRGEIAISQFRDSDGEGLEVLALDQGPGMQDVQKCLMDGYSTTGSAGTGLGAVQRLSSVFGIYSKPGQGTAVLGRLRARPNVNKGFLVGAVTVTCPGETVCGDGWSVVQHHRTASVLLTDGSGHGPLAAQAAELAISTFHQRNSASIEQLMASMHRALMPTRGAALAVARLEPSQGYAQFCGIGNISATITSSPQVRKLVSMNGVAGHGTPRVRCFQYPFAYPSILILHSDGLSMRWDLEQYRGLARAHPALIAGVLARDHRRGRDDATVLVARFGTA